MTLLNRSSRTRDRVAEKTGLLSSRPVWVLAALTLLLCAVSISASEARAERWMCPECDEMIDRPAGAALDCQVCGVSFTEDDLTWYVASVNYRTRDAEISFLILPEDCGIFRADGLQALDNAGPYWVPWTKVDYFIPRMRLVRLIDGREVGTDYPKGPTCPKPPNFIFEITETWELPNAEPREQKREVEEDMAALFVVARNDEALERGVQRFIHDVEVGLHPRLPRTSARATRALPPALPNRVPVDEIKDKKVVVRARIANGRQLQKIQVVESSGYPDLDNACIARVRGSGLMGAGEMGVSVPATVEFHYTFLEGEPAVEFVVPENSIWEDRAVRAKVEGQ